MSVTLLDHFLEVKCCVAVRLVQDAISNADTPPFLKEMAAEICRPLSFGTSTPHIAMARQTVLQLHMWRSVQGMESLLQDVTNVLDRIDPALIERRSGSLMGAQL